MPSLISFSGIDGAGKSTQIGRISEEYLNANKKFVYLWTRGGNTPGVTWLKSVIRKISPVRLPPPGRSAGRTKLLAKPKVQTLWLVGAILELYWIYGVFVRWQILMRRTVFCDRYVLDTLIDFTVLFPNIKVETWILWKGLVAISPKPSASFFFEIPLEASFTRCQEKYEPFPDTDEEKRLRYALYTSYFTEDKVTVLDGMDSEDAIASKILGVIDGQ